MENKVAKTAVVHGKVQGVWFRASTQQRAAELGVVGWVRNLPDGTVALHAEGTEQAVAALLDWCQTGPPQAIVNQVVSQTTEPLQAKLFEILK
ncbi:MAG TPA: acylphosphatase [Cytophagales bacterium]|nr:acylphosphatase [Cytophagales bacterium]